MLRWRRHALIVFSLSFGLMSSAWAHSPYFGQRESINRPDFANVVLAVLYGDGIFFADPSQVVVFDNEGYLLAATPQSTSLFIQCERSDGKTNCRVYDELQGLIFEPNYEQWKRSRIVVKDGHPLEDAYPEYMDIDYGFNQRPATFIEIISFEAKGILKAPIASLLWVLWSCATWSLMARLVWQWKGHGFHILPINWWAIFKGALSILAFIGMNFLGAIVSLQPLSDYFFLFVFIVGGVLAAILTRPKIAG
jgi:hypothetical protein